MSTAITVVCIGGHDTMLYALTAKRKARVTLNLNCVTNAVTPLRWFVLDAKAMTDLDVAVMDACDKVMDLMDGHDISFAIARTNRPITNLLDHYGALLSIGGERLCPSTCPAMGAYRKEHPGNVAKSTEAKAP